MRTQEDAQRERLATRPVAAVRPGPADLQEPVLGPLSTALGQAFLVGALVHGFGILFVTHQRVSAVLLSALAFGCLVLAPRSLVRQVRVSLPLLALVLWMVASWTWSVNPAQTYLRLETLVPVLLGMMVVTGLLPERARLVALRWSIRVTLLVSVVSVATSASARISGDDEFAVPGWRGTFSDKNSLALYLVFALAATVVLDRGRSRWLTSIVIAVLLGGAQSATGIVSALLVLALCAWLPMLRRRTGRQRALFVVATTAMVLGAAAALAVNVTAVLASYGKDTSLTGRTDIWAAVLGAIRERPLHGYGLGAPLVDVAAPSTVTLRLWREIGFTASHAHDGTLDLVGQLGLLGLVLFLLAFGTTARAAARRLHTAPAAATFALVLLSAQVLMSVSENVFLGPWLLVLLLLQAPLLVPAPLPVPGDGAGGPGEPSVEPLGAAGPDERGLAARGLDRRR